MCFHVEFFLEAIWSGINMDSPDASVGATDAPNEAPECWDDFSTVLGKRTADDQVAASSSNAAVSPECAVSRGLEFLRFWRARARPCAKLKLSNPRPTRLLKAFKGHL